MSGKSELSGLARRELQSDLQLYLKSIHEVPLLTAEEERELGWAIINENCARSRERMVRANLRLVVSIAKNYMNRGLPLPDLFRGGPEVKMCQDMAAFCEDVRTVGAEVPEAGEHPGEDRVVGPGRRVDREGEDAAHGSGRY